jgi:hypothetical protein
MTQDSSAPSGFANSLKLACTTADTSIGAAELVSLSQIIEGQNVQAFAKGTSDAKPYAVSFWVKGNASATYVCELFDGDNTRHVCSTFSVTTDWTRVEITFPADTTGAFDDDNAASLYLQIFLHAGSNFSSGTLPSAWAAKTNANRAVGGSSFFDSTARTFFITGVQLEVGQNATEFEHEPYAVTLRKCQRYYQRIETNDGAPNYNGHINASAGSQIIVPLMVQTRTPFTGITVTNVGSWGNVVYGSLNRTCNSITFSNASTQMVLLDANDGDGGGFTIGQGCMLYDASADGVIEFTGAEL